VLWRKKDGFFFAEKTQKTLAPVCRVTGGAGNHASDGKCLFASFSSETEAPSFFPFLHHPP
jgi:hypothetical protein